jgi:hypothetical protein
VCDKETKEVFFFIKSGSTTALICVIIIIRRVLDFNNSGGRYTCTKVVWKEYRICIFIQFLIVCEIKSKERIQQVSNYKILTFYNTDKCSGGSRLNKKEDLFSFFITHTQKGSEVSNFKTKSL